MGFSCLFHPFNWFFAIIFSKFPEKQYIDTFLISFYMNQLVQLKISLEKTKPAIWRRIIVDSSISFFELHHTIQLVMGWTNSHLFEFKVNGYTLGRLSQEPEFNEKLIDSCTATLEPVLSESEKFSYIYDFGDYWKHEILVEGFFSKEPGKTYPACIEGELCCPPEDCGGIPGFYHLQEISKNKKHPEYKETLTWLGKSNSFEHFDKERVNKSLLKLKKYMADDVKRWE